MDQDALVSILLALSSVGAGFTIGRRGLSSETVQMLQAQVEAHERDKAERNEKIVILEGRLEVLESLVTQRAAVDEVREIVDRIADRVGA